MGFVDMRVDEALRPADTVVARDKAALRELSRLDAIRRGDAPNTMPMRIEASAPMSSASSAAEAGASISSPTARAAGRIATDG